MTKTAAISFLSYEYSEAIEWAGTSRARATDADVIAAYRAGRKSPEFKAMVKRIRTQAR